jgi:beta-glucanase (GH16 family)
MVSAFLDPSSTRMGFKEPLLRAAPDGRSLTLVFSDDFQIFRPWTGRDGIWQAMPTEESPFGRDRLGAVVDGFDAFPVAQPAPDRVGTGIAGYPYVSGLISTQPSFSQTYGYFEMRAELPQGKGLWPAFWMLPKDDSWPPEIDVVESIGDPSHVQMTAHSKHGQAGVVEARIAPNAFHTFAVSWDARDLIWYVDGGEAGRVETPDDMHKPMYLLANLAVGGDWLGSAPRFPAKRFPAKLMIDYIRAYRFDI